MSSIQFDPYIGESFSKTKTLIVGESHYCDPNDIEKKSQLKDFTKLVISDILDDSFVSKTHKNLEKILCGSYVPKNKVYYDQIAFYQLIQRPMSSIKERPKKKDYENGFDILFKEVIPKVKPERILFLGVESVNKAYLSFAKKNPEYNLSSVNCGPKLGVSYSRFFDVESSHFKGRLLWIKHTGMSINCEQWRKYLASEHPDFLIH